ncbi:unnamed protein product [Caenorhabditis angaria]|uniref:Uncharacterized protein n=1 Tax=Caenorhabditis angaria TaxID=860376 RepID=A0A9P1N1B3_9PELO|nr:unnamed protein product [Caenorhabditis angaria]
MAEKAVAGLAAAQQLLLRGAGAPSVDQILPYPWQMALFQNHLANLMNSQISPFGGQVLPSPLIPTKTTPKKGGFDVSDLLAKP